MTVRHALLVFTLIVGACAEPKPAGPASPTAAISVATSETPATATEKPESDARVACHRGMGALAQSFREQLTATVYVHPNTGRVGAAATAIEAVLSKVAASAPAKIIYRVVDANSDAVRARAEKLGVSMATFEDGDSSTLGMLGVVFEYGSEREVIPTFAIDQLGVTEFWVANKMRQIRDRNDNTLSRVGIVTGKAEIPLDEQNLSPSRDASSGPSLQSVIEQALPFYKFETADIHHDVDGDLVGLVVTQPGDDYTDEELQRIDAFVMQGGSLMVVAGAVNMPPFEPKMEGTLDTHRLEVLLSGYGVELKPQVILDPQLGLTIPVVTTSGTDNMQALSILEVSSTSTAPTLDNSFPGFYRLSELAFPFASPLVLAPDKQPDAKLTIVASTSPQAVAVSESPIDLSLRHQALPQASASKMAIAVTVQGMLKSAFDPTKVAEARVLVIASPQFLANPFARAGNSPPMPPQMQMMGALGGDDALQRLATPYAQAHLTTTILAFKNAIDWMGANDDLVACSALLTKLNQHEGSKRKPKGSPNEKTGCTKEQLIKLVETGLNIDDAVEVCAKQKKQ